MNALPPYELADHIRRLRKVADLTQEQLADKAEIGVTTLRQIETRVVRNPDPATLGKLATALGREVVEFLALLPSIAPEAVGGGVTPAIEDRLIALRRASDRMSPRAKELAEVYDQLPAMAQLAIDAVIRAYRELLA